MSAGAPSPVQYVAYCCGRVLPPEFDDWVREDLAGPGARRRTLIRVSVPAL